MNDDTGTQDTASAPDDAGLGRWVLTRVGGFVVVVALFSAVAWTLRPHTEPADALLMADLAARANCVDLATASTSAPPHEQGSCRINGARVDLQTFPDDSKRDTYTASARLMINLIEGGTGCIAYGHLWAATASVQTACSAFATATGGTTTATE